MYSFKIPTSFAALTLIGVTAFCFFNSCALKEKKQDTDSANLTIPFDTVEKQLIDTMVFRINSQLRATGRPQKLAYNLYNPTDSLTYWLVGNQSARVSMEWKLPDGVKWPTFFVYEGELVMVRYRYFLDTPPDSKAYESMIYLNDGKIVYCEERGHALNEGDVPGMIRGLPLERTKRSYAEVEKDYKPYWIDVMAHMKKNNVLPDYFKP